jgi:LEA14-like dessication related protein
LKLSLWNHTSRRRFVGRTLNLFGYTGLTATGGLGLVIASSTSGCNAVPPLNLKSPEVSFSDLAVSDIGLSQVRFIVTVDAKNSNDVDIPLSDAKFELSLMGNSFANGVSKEQSIVIPKNGNKTIPIEFTVPTGQIIDAVKKVVSRDASTQTLNNFNYVLKGSARWGSGPFTVPFERKGDLSALKKLTDVLRPFLRG